MKTIIGASIGSCVHVGGLHHFLSLRKQRVTIQFLMVCSLCRKNCENNKEEKPDIMAISYRLTPESASELFSELKAEISKEYR